jgi:hypothetical protein
MRLAMNRLSLAAGCGLLLASIAVADEAAEQAVTIGQPAPDVTLTGIDGKDFKLSDVTDSGKNVALIFSRAHW